MAAARSVALLLAVLLTASIPAAAQDLSAAPPAPGSNRLYAHVDQGVTTHWMNTLEMDGAETNPGRSGATQTFTWSLPLLPGLPHTLLLSGEPATSTVFLGANSGVGSLTASTRLLADGVAVAESGEEDVTVLPGTVTNQYTQVDFTLPFTTDAIPAGSTLVWEVYVEGAASAIFMGMSAGRGRSFLELPIAAVEGGADEAVDQRLFLFDETNETLALGDHRPEGTSISNRVVTTWSGALPPVLLSGQANVTHGHWNLTITDADGRILLERSWAAGANEEVRELLDGRAPWNVTVDQDRYTGNVSLMLEPAATATSPPSEAREGEAGSEGGAKAEPVAAAADVGKDSPAPALAPLALAAAAILLRRRRA